jgi:hypothetical protein
VKHSLALTLAFMGAGCHLADDDAADVAAAEAEEAEDAELLALEAAAACVPLDNRSVVETNASIVNDQHFSMERVFEQIRTTTPAGVTVPPSATAMFKQIYSSFNDCTSSATLDPRHFGMKCRTLEGQLGSLNPFTGISGELRFKPVALFNRFDLAPTTFATCGESRIVYWKNSGPPGRASLIVELRTPPVTLPDGTKSCRPIAEFWASLSTINDPTVRARELAKYYFQGLPGMPFPPVSAHGAGFNGAGQIRSDSRMHGGDEQWNLREFKWQQVCPAGTSICSARMVPVSTKNNPSQKLFSGVHPRSPDFQTWFIQSAVPTLAAAPTIHGLSLGNPDRWNTFESISEPMAGDLTLVTYKSVASTAFKNRITNKLNSLGSSLTANNILDRATTQTCGGCHMISDGQNLGGGKTWPITVSIGFNHINEQRELSPALTNKFLPRRKALLGAFLCSGTNALQTSEEMSATIGGTAPDAPN